MRDAAGAAGDGRPFALAQLAEKGSDPFCGAHVHIAIATLAKAPRNL